MFLHLEKFGLPALAAASSLTKLAVETRALLMKPFAGIGLQPLSPGGASQIDPGVSRHTKK